MIKKIAIVLFIGGCLFKLSYASEINLLCDISYTENKFGEINRDTVKTHVRVSFDKGQDVIIIPDSSIFPSVSTFTNQSTGRVGINHSSPTSWNVETNQKLKEMGSTVNNSIIIDRSAGSITINSTLISTVGLITLNGYGTCSKIDASKMKF